MIYKQGIFKTFLCSVAFILFAVSFANCEQNGLTVVDSKDAKLGPRIEFALPNGVVDVVMQQKLLNTNLYFKTRYDYFDNNINTNLDINYGFKVFFFGIEFSDKVDFEEPFSSIITLQRSRYIKPYVGAKVTEHTSFVTSTRFQNSFTVEIANQTLLDSGKNIVQSLAYIYDSYDKIIPGYSKGSKVFLEFGKSFSGDYDYTLSDLKAVKTFNPGLQNTFLDAELSCGYPVSNISKPITELYSLGGYEKLKGYDYKEFRGDAYVYSSLTYHLPFVSSHNLLKTEINILSMDLQWEAGKTGNEYIFEKNDDIKSSVGAGFSLFITIAKSLQIKSTLSVNQAFYSKEPRVYFGISAVSYKKD